MILVGIDDTDTLESPGTNQVARAIVAELPPSYCCYRLVRHQLFFDPRVPYTSKNGSCSIWLEHDDPTTPETLDQLFQMLKRSMLARFVPGSDPGLCLTDIVPAAVIEHGRRCKQDLVTQAEARQVARENGIRLEGLGGTEMGVIGSLAAIGLAATADDGRVVEMRRQPDDLCGPQPIELLFQRGIDEVRCIDSSDSITAGIVDIGKHLRPNLRGGRIVQFVEPTETGIWRGVRLL